MAENFGKLRRAMVDSQVRTTDVTDLRLIDAMLAISREAFVPAKMKSLAYIDEDILVGPNRFLMEPSPFAKLAQLADIQASDLVLDIGCATGYSSAVFSKLATAVIALECDADLVLKAAEALSAGGFDNVVIETGKLNEGLASESPYDVIFIGGAVDFVPQALLDQLKNGGRLAVVEGRGTVAFAKLYVKDDAGVVSARKAFNLCAKTLPGFGKATEFAF